MQVVYPAHQIRADLDRQRMEWRFIETTARIVCRGEANQFLATLVGTRVAFEDLCNELADGLERAQLANQRRDLMARAQAAIDILVRNLFERTADVGFIATDAALMAYLADPAGQDAQALRKRLRLYRSFYSVYADIALINQRGELVWRLDEEAGLVTRAGPPQWFGGCLRADGYVEVYETHAWWGTEPALIYAHRVRNPDGGVLGVVTLRFALADELKALCTEVLGDQPQATLAFVDARGQVLQGSDAQRLPNGSCPRTQGNPPLSVRLGNADYPMAQTTSPGYQGYAGPGWRAWVVCGTAQRSSQSATDLPSLQQAQQDLQTILIRAQETAADLRLVLFNGKVTETGVQDVAALRVVLDQIGLAGTRTLALFDQAISSLSELLEGGLQSQAMSQARLAVSILDRNLYERANDCRWWALNAVFGQTLQAAAAAATRDRAALAAQAQPVLSHLNDLYTVYRQVALFDHKGRVLAVSRPGTQPHPQQMAADTLSAMSGLRTPADYLAVRPVSPQENADVWTYVAAVRAPDGRALGGVALYFETRRELTAMLEAVCVGAGWSGAAYRIGATQWVVETAGAAASRPQDASQWPLPDTAVAVAGDHDGRPVLGGIARSQGYREFLRSDGHTDWAWVLLLHADKRFEAVASGRQFAQGIASGPTRSFGVVRIGDAYLGFDVADIHLALRLRRWLATPVSPPALGAVEASDGSTWPLLDARQIHGQHASPITGISVGLVLHGTQSDFVWLFDELMGVVVAPQSAIAAVSGRQAPWITAVLKESGDEAVRVQLVDLSKVPPPLQALGTS